MRILIVDDSRTMRLILKRILAELGHLEIVEAEDGAVALLRLAEFDPEVALVDWNMPVMNGIEFVAALREQPLFDHTKVLMVTSESSGRAVYEALKAGADEFTTKPVTRRGIEEKLALLGLS